MPTPFDGKDWFRNNIKQYLKLIDGKLTAVAVSPSDIETVIDGYINSNPATDGVIITNGNISLAPGSLPPLP